MIAHATQIGLPGELRWFDRSGHGGGSVGAPAEYLDFELSPDERTVAVSRVDPALHTADVWLLDPARNVSTRFTLDPQNDASALWSPDGGRIAFRSNRHGQHRDLPETIEWNGSGTTTPRRRGQSDHQRLVQRREVDRLHEDVIDGRIRHLGVAGGARTPRRNSSCTPR